MRWQGDYNILHVAYIHKIYNYAISNKHRYLRVPSLPGTGGGSSADSILSSSSGHLLSETGTPGTISSASSMDDIDSSCRSTLSNLFTALFQYLYQYH